VLPDADLGRRTRGGRRGDFVEGGRGGGRRGDFGEARAVVPWWGAPRWSKAGAAAGSGT
jgi:hypothetical protein